MSISMLGALIHAEPDKARAQILDAIRQTKGDRKAAADVLGTTHRSLYRFIERLKLWDAIDRMIEENHWPRVVGPPRAAERIRDAILASRGNIGRAATNLGVSPDSLRSRIVELNLLDDLNRRLSGMPGCKPIRIQQSSGERAHAR